MRQNSRDARLWHIRKLKSYDEFKKTGASIDVLAKKYKMGTKCLGEFISDELSKKEAKLPPEREIESFTEEPRFIEITARRELINGKIVDFLPSLFNFD